MIDQNAALTGTANASAESGERASSASVEQAMAGLAGHQPAPPPKPLIPGELKYKLTMMLFPAILLVFVALYVASLASGIDPEVGLFRAGGVSLVLAIIARMAIGILGDETRLVLSDQQIVAMARSGAVRDYLAAAAVQPGDTPGTAGTEQPATTARATGVGGKE
jgi:hypothetical protein